MPRKGPLRRGFAPQKYSVKRFALTGQWEYDIEAAPALASAVAAVLSLLC